MEAEPRRHDVVRDLEELHDTRANARGSRYRREKNENQSRSKPVLLPRNYRTF
jgi:hypothetical protein